jgi:hypothetical protein
VLGNRSPVPLIGNYIIIRTAARLMGPELPLLSQGLTPTTARIASLKGLVTGARPAAGAHGAATVRQNSPRLGYRSELLSCASSAA